jgi:hypothetical protein
MKTAIGLVAIVAARMLAVPTTWSQQGLIQGTVDANEVFTNALVDEINRFDQQAVIRQAWENR